jgi:regulator of nonsense transcripts 1
MFLPLLLLQVQYRMHPALSSFPSARFYGGRLQDGVSPDQRLVPRGIRWPNAGVPLMFVDIAGKEVRRSGAETIPGCQKGVCAMQVTALPVVFIVSYGAYACSQCNCAEALT